MVDSGRLSQSTINSPSINSFTPTNQSKSKTAMTQTRARTASGGNLRSSGFFRCRLFHRETVTNRALQRVGGNGRGDFHVRLQEMQKKTVFAQLFPFRQGELGDELLVGGFRRHTDLRKTRGLKT